MLVKDFLEVVNGWSAVRITEDCHEEGYVFYTAKDSLTELPVKLLNYKVMEIFSERYMGKIATRISVIIQSPDFDKAG